MCILFIVAPTVFWNGIPIIFLDSPISFHSPIAIFSILIGSILQLQDIKFFD